METVTTRSFVASVPVGVGVIGIERVSVLAVMAMIESTETVISALLLSAELWLTEKKILPEIKLKRKVTRKILARTNGLISGFFLMI